MKITIELYATFRNGRFKDEQREYMDGITVGHVVDDLGIDRGEVGMALVNGRHASMEQVLSEGEVVALFSMLGGG